MRLAFLFGALASACAQLTLPQIALMSEGDHQLRQAYAAAYAASYSTWLTTFGTEPSFSYALSCPMNSTTMPFPAKPVGTLANILNSGIIKLAYNGGLVQVTQSNKVLQDGTTNPPTGLAPTFFTAVAQALGNAYGRQYLTVQWFACSATDSTGCYDMLLSGVVDIVPMTYHVGSSYRGLARYYSAEPSSCFTYAAPNPIWYLTSRASALFGATTPSIQALQALIQAGQTPRVVCQTLASQNAIQGFLGISVAVVSDSAAIYAGLTAATPLYDFVYVAAPNPSSLMSSVSVLPGNSLGVHIVSFFRRPALLGAASSTLNPSLASMAYPLDGNTLAVGQEQWKLAFDAAIAVTQSNGAWKAAFGSLTNVSRLETGLSGTQYYPFPVPVPGGKLDQVIKSGVIKAGFPNNSFINDYNGVSIMDSRTSTLSGAAVSYMNAVAQAFGAAYSTTITVQWNTNMATTAAGLPLLVNNQLDVFPLVAAYGANDNVGVNRAINFEFSSSPTFTIDYPVWVKTTSTFTDLPTLLQAVTAGTATLGALSSVMTAELGSKYKITADLGVVAGVLSGLYTAGISGVTPAEAAQGLRCLGSIGTSVRGHLFAPVPYMNSQNTPATPTPGPSAPAAPSGSNADHGGVIALGIICALLVIALIVVVVMKGKGAPGPLGQGNPVTLNPVNFSGAKPTV